MISRPGQEVTTLSLKLALPWLFFLLALPSALAANPAAPAADVREVRVSGASGAYQFTVTVASPDLGCRQYADWWEVVGEDGRLLYRRVLLHSHVDEQPFTRSGGPVPVKAKSVVWVRAHMKPDGYVGKALKGSVKTGFREAQPGPQFATELERKAPLPDDCDF